jgi:hypothetical protein
MVVINKKFATDKMPQLGDKEVAGEKVFVYAVGVKLKQQSATEEYYFDLDKKYFIAKDREGNFINGRIK